MKLLIVDDETLTRNGLLETIDWKKLGITQIFCAYDGESGLSMFKKHSPDILLTDVRMPRRDGISLATEVQKFSPDCSIIFMSGYSDKEYLKAAINLHAVRYVEKPIDVSEIQDAVSESVYRLKQLKIILRRHELIEQESFAQLAINLTHPNFTPSQEQYSTLGQTNLNVGVYITTILDINPFLSEYPQEVIHRLLSKIVDYARCIHCKLLYSVKNGKYLILHLLAVKEPSSQSLHHFLTDTIHLFTQSQHTIGAIGKTVTQLTKLYLSYNSAVILLQSGFFFEHGAILSEKDKENSSPVSLEVSKARILEHLNENQLMKAKQSEEQLFLSLIHNREYLPDQIKDCYYRFLSALQSTAFRTQIIYTDPEKNSSILGKISACHSLYSLHSLYVSQLDLLSCEINAQRLANDTPTIYLIKDYIHQEFKNPSLSIKEISDHVHLSTSYLCTLFKTETGTTLNQYITDYRLEKAKLLLKDPRHKITEVSFQVGYTDGNYFGKSFKKIVGLSPSEYREKELS